MNKERFVKYVQICDRVEKMGFDIDRVNVLMDIKSADVKFNLRLDDWLGADDFNFIHDFYGIQNTIVRDVFPATDFGFFVPRFSGISLVKEGQLETDS